MVPVPFRTLDRNLLTPEDYVDLSDVRGIAVDAEATTPPPENDNNEDLPYIPYGRRQHFIDGAVRVTSHTPFPVNTRGFFYFWCRPLIPVSGSIRFRVVQGPDPKLFNQGTDLLNEFGTPWEIPLLAIAGVERYVCLRDVLLRLRPGLHARKSLERVGALKASSTRPGETRFGPLSQVLYEVGEPFYISLVSHNEAVFFAGDEQIYKLYARNFLNAHFHSDWPYEAGILKCRFELNQGGFVVRVLRIVEPLRVKAKILRKAPFVADPPQAGQLLTRDGHPKRFFRSREEGSTAVVRETLLRRYNAARQPKYQRHAGVGRVGATQAEQRQSSRTLQSKSSPPMYDKDWQPPTVDVALRTLRPDNLVASDSVDLSDARGVAYDPAHFDAHPDANTSGYVPYLTYGRRQTRNAVLKTRVLTYTPFPVNTRGFFYYRAHPSVPEGGSLRFRVVPSRDPADFATGADLETEFGTPWQIALVAIATQPRLALVRAVLEREELVSPAGWTRAAALEESLGQNRVGAMSQIVFQAGEPFYVDLADPEQTVYVAGDGVLQRVTPRHMFITRFQKAEYIWKYTGGVLRCALVLFGHKKTEKAVYVEVQREIEPVRESDERVIRSRYVQTPVVGQLLQMQHGVYMDLFLSPDPAKRAVKKSLFKRGMQGATGQQT
ncbi:uncharacterized protein TRAVEDRAFT_48693 [Trametes versicolor FP-101664 SS1]|uniref:uncharacterized protein n=1 Tax=Trametes versicolor (strain FP-101664) TaxID=717944 RepID=UPI0004621BB2|nr:uncharacterized protein TRAVEDRAFT_48693 [Trametes versicolor FP-101664 SS1]EIW57662.1 hypothetical protein TRAVEDRAFT_48693 [Trametes versicolor FP-101664 SS1]